MTDQQPPSSPAPAASSTDSATPDTATNVITGTGVVPGIAYAPVAWKRGRFETLPTLSRLTDDERPAEVERLTAAADVVAERFERRAQSASGSAAEVLTATAALARDRGWRRAATKHVKAGTPAAEATVAAMAEFIAAFEKLGGLMAERTTDLRDIRDRVIAELLGQPEPGVPTPSSPIVLMADDLAPADTAGLDPTLVTAIVTELGGPTSHTTIIARQLGIPCIVAAPGIRECADDVEVLVDGGAGTITLGADPDEARAAVTADLARRDAIRQWRGPAQTSDGVAVEVLANVQDGAGARAASSGEARGVGLFRTELCFLDSEREPSVAEQAAIYREVLEAFPEHKVVVRTLDAGSDKPLKFANMEHEDNPALGVRGVRIAGRDRGLLTRQLDAVAQASESAGGSGRAEAWVMAPMIATIPEARDFAALCRERDLRPGIMVEVPSVALLAPAFLEHVDFLSIGTNDLTQYTMAADRMSPHLAELTDAWQPAVLTLIGMTARAGRAAGKPVGVCGEAAADPVLACVLHGLGVTSLSMAAPAIAAVGAQLGAVTQAQCEEAAQAALAAPDSAAAKRAARDVLA